MPVAAVLVAAVCAGALVLYVKWGKRSTQELAFVRVGYGGVRVVMDGRRTLCIPILQVALPVNMRPMRLTGSLPDGGVEAAFDVRVRHAPEAVHDAVQTLGLKTMNPEELAGVLAEKLSAALANAAKGTPGGTAGDPEEYAARARLAAEAALAGNGLEVEAVRLVRVGPGGAIG